jgi:WD40 repeat protein
MEIKTAVFSPDGKSMLTAALDNTVKFWWTPRTIYDWLKRADVRSFSAREKEEYGISETKE